MAAGDITIVGTDTAAANIQNNAVQWADVGTIQSGDLALLFWGHSNGVAPGSETTQPTGFTLVDSQLDGTEYLAVWKRVCTGSESGSVTCGLAGIARHSVVLVVLRGARDVDLVTKAADAGSDANHTAPSVTPDISDAGVLVGTGERATTGSSSTTQPTGYTLAAEASAVGTSGNYVTVGYRGSAGLLDKLTANAAESPGTWVHNTGQTDVSQLTVAVRPSIIARSISDTGAGSDSLARSSSRPRALSDTGAGTDAVARSLAESRAISDTGAGADSVARQASHPRSLSDTGAGTDSVARGLAESRSVADSGAGTDSVARGQAASRSVADSAPATDSCARSSARPRSCSDSGGGSDALARGLSLPRGVSDAAGGTDAAARALATSRPVSDSAALTDLVAASSAFARAVLDNAPASDAVASSEHSDRPPDPDRIRVIGHVARVRVIPPVIRIRTIAEVDRIRVVPPVDRVRVIPAPEEEP